MARTARGPGPARAHQCQQAWAGCWPWPVPPSLSFSLASYPRTHARTHSTHAHMHTKKAGLLPPVGLLPRAAMWEAHLASCRYLPRTGPSSGSALDSDCPRGHQAVTGPHAAPDCVNVVSCAARLAITLRTVGGTGSRAAGGCWLPCRRVGCSHLELRGADEGEALRQKQHARAGGLRCLVGQAGKAHRCSTALEPWLNTRGVSGAGCGHEL